ncbi:MAG: type II secretion system protein [bacterium]|nr:type II secretion system protein [bacterium]
MKKYIPGRNNKGLTLVELLVVIAITAIISTLAISRLNPLLQFQKGNDSKRKATVAKVQVALEQYVSDKGYYPLILTDLTQGTPVYLVKSPNGDPKSTDVYTYTPSPMGCDNSTTNCTGYTLFACLENLKDAQLDTPTDQSGADLCTAAGVISYTVTNQ